MNDLANAYNDIKKLWLELEPQAKSLSQDVNKRYALAKDSYHRKIQELISEQQKLKLELLIEKANLCTQIEQSNDNNDDAINHFKEQWLAFEQSPVNGSQLKQRFNNALESKTADKTSLIEKELQNKYEYCLTYEILLGKDSPQEYQQSRMEKQIELLNSNLGNNIGEDLSDDKNSIYELQIKWYEFTNYAHNHELEQRFQKLISD